MRPDSQVRNAAPKCKHVGSLCRVLPSFKRTHHSPHSSKRTSVHARRTNSRGTHHHRPNPLKRWIRKCSPTTDSSPLIEKPRRGTHTLTRFWIEATKLNRKMGDHSSGQASRSSQTCFLTQISRWVRKIALLDNHNRSGHESSMHYDRIHSDSRG